MKHSNTIKILAALTAAPRWAIALMPADGAMFPWSGESWFEIASGLLSLAFAAVEIWATSFIMQAWHEAQANGDEHLARNLRRLWVTTLVVLAAALVPPMYANVMRVNVNTFAPPLLAAWLVCVAASTFLVIGGVGYADRAQPVAGSSDAATNEDDCHCPICLSVIGLLASMSDQAQYAAYCDKCKRAYTDDEVIWFPERLRPSKEALKDWQPAALTPQAAASDDVPHDSQPLAPLTDHLVRAVWLAKKANAPFADVADEARQCLNGTSAALEAWLATGKQSLNELAALFGVADESRKMFDATCRGLRKPNGATIERD